MSLESEQALTAAKEQFERARQTPTNPADLSQARAQLAIAAALIAIAEQLKSGRTW